MPGSATKEGVKPPPQRTAISIKGLTPGVAFQLAECCHPIPGDRIVGLRREGEGIEVHVIGCDSLADGIDADWVDLAWGDQADGGATRLSVVIKNQPGSLAVVAGILGCARRQYRLDGPDRARRLVPHLPVRRRGARRPASDADPGGAPGHRRGLDRGAVVSSLTGSRAIRYAGSIRKISPSKSTI